MAAADGGVALWCAAVRVQIQMGHVAAPNEAWQPIAAGLHVLAAAVWIGGLPALLTALDVDAVSAARQFSLIDIAAVVTLATTALEQCIDLAGGLPGCLVQRGDMRHC